MNYVCDKIRIVNNRCQVYTSAVFLKNLTFISTKDQQIDVYDDFEYKKTLNTCRAYNTINFYKRKKCFIATDRSENIYMLDFNFKEIDSIFLNYPRRIHSQITSISYSEDDEIFVISNKIATFTTSLSGDFIKILYWNRIEPFSFDCSRKNYDVASECISNNYLVSRIVDKSAYIYEIHKKQYVNKYLIDDDIEILSINHKGHYTFLFVRKGNVYYVYIVCFCNDCICKYRTGNLIGKIACAENKIGNILSEEGKKTSKIFKESNSIENLLDVSKKVNQRLTELTNIELVLTEQLDIIKDNT